MTESLQLWPHTVSLPHIPKHMTSNLNWNVISERSHSPSLSCKLKRTAGQLSLVVHTCTLNSWEVEASVVGPSKKKKKTSKKVSPFSLSLSLPLPPHSTPACLFGCLSGCLHSLCFLRCSYLVIFSFVYLWLLPLEHKHRVLRVFFVLLHSAQAIHAATCVSSKSAWDYRKNS